ncbi:hypothetical protein SISNIDRAFT_458946 [Sistotremastrum niveocremeum HHB9708]|uniref:Uncharacterized protein n=1 Tax=Sistotremastrum niveocremeum HHB9708 TaxID=1314777 RepID=A0A164Q0X1_9AGAM|nr:hypothetical protein SISNIDRAFT_458946 [Sistotremastrum niveocremeum HHB9708]
MVAFHGSEQYGSLRTDLIKSGLPITLWKVLEGQERALNVRLLMDAENCLRNVSWDSLRDISAIQASTLLGLVYDPHYRVPSVGCLDILHQAYTSLKKLCGFVFQHGASLDGIARYWSTPAQEEEVKFSESISARVPCSDMNF